VFASTREDARRRAINALRSYAILGVRTNIPFLLEVLAHPQFAAADIDTRFLDREAANIAAAIPTVVPDALIAFARSNPGISANSGTPGTPGTAAPDPFQALRGWRG
jgi:3-methylcrotonyl-CoA carboxylase alpha subunit